jgi:[ribosomal protein S5]-alanine N-acetyltransferase
VSLRPLHVGDAELLAGMYAAQADFLAPFEPDRPADFATVAGQRRSLALADAERLDDRVHRFLIEAGGEPAGVLSLSRITRGPFQNGGLGYWVAREHNGRGVATRAVGLLCEWAFGEARLHRVEAATLVDNLPSQAVLRKNRFTAIGVSPRYLHIAGAWRDHLLFARTAED